MGAEHLSMRILLLEDDPRDAARVTAMLAAGGLEPEVVRVAGRDEFRAALRQGGFALVVAEYSLPAFDGTAALALVREHCPDVPFLFVSGPIGEERAVESLKHGAADFILKSRLERLAPAVLRALRELEARTEQRRSKESLRRQVLELTAGSRRQTRFLAILSHELRNPLAAISNALHLVRRQSGGNPSLERAGELIARQVQNLVRLTQDVLDLSRMGEGRLAIHKARLDLGSLVRAAAEESRAAPEAAQLVLRMEVPEAPVWVEGDPTRLTQVCTHLLSNAIKFTDPGGEVTVRLSVGSEQWSAVSSGPLGGDAPSLPSLPTAHCPLPTAVLTVSDTGMGLAPEVLAELFDPFVPAEDSPSRGQSGLGLGLALVKGLVELHGGQVRAASEGPGRGAAFTVWLPLAEDRRA